ncbi:MULTISPECIES: hypothetical protein [unclassified Micromonospora]
MSGINPLIHLNTPSPSAMTTSDLSRTGALADRIGAWQSPC